MDTRALDVRLCPQSVRKVPASVTLAVPSGGRFDAFCLAGAPSVFVGFVEQSAGFGELEVCQKRILATQSGARRKGVKVGSCVGRSTWKVRGRLTWTGAALWSFWFKFRGRRSALECLCRLHGRRELCRARGRRNALELGTQISWQAQHLGALREHFAAGAAFWSLACKLRLRRGSLNLGDVFERCDCHWGSLRGVFAVEGISSPYLPSLAYLQPFISPETVGDMKEGRR